MEPSKYSIDRVFRIWDDKTGERVDVREDGDGLGLVAIVPVNVEGRDLGEVTMTHEMAELLAQCLVKYVQENRKITAVSCPQPTHL